MSDLWVTVFTNRNPKRIFAFRKEGESENMLDICFAELSQRQSPRSCPWATLSLQGRERCLWAPVLSLGLFCASVSNTVLNNGFFTFTPWTYKRFYRSAVLRPLQGKGIVDTDVLHCFTHISSVLHLCVFHSITFISCVRWHSTAPLPERSLLLPFCDSTHPFFTRIPSSPLTSTDLYYIFRILLFQNVLHMDLYIM